MQRLATRRYTDQLTASRPADRIAPTSRTAATSTPRRSHQPPSPSSPTRPLDPGRVVLTPKQASRILGIAEPTLRNWRYLGRGPKFIKMGAAVRYRLSDLDAYLEASLRRSTSDLGPDAA